MVKKEEQSGLGKADIAMHLHRESACLYMHACMHAWLQLRI